MSFGCVSFRACDAGGIGSRVPAAGLLGNWQGGKNSSCHSRVSSSLLAVFDWVNNLMQALFRTLCISGGVAAVELLVDSVTVFGFGVPLFLYE